MDFLQIFGLNLAQRADTVVFMLIALAAAAVLVVTFLVGEVFGIASDVADFEDPSAGLLNVQTVSAFLAGFGSIGWLLAGYFDVNSLVAAIGGIAGGVPMAGAAVMLSRLFMKQEVSTSFRVDELAGTEAMVTLAIPAVGVGRVQYAKAGGTHTAAARSQSQTAIPQGTVVVIRRIVGNEVLVERAEA